MHKYIKGVTTRESEHRRRDRRNQQRSALLRIVGAGPLQRLGVVGRKSAAAREVYAQIGHGLSQRK